MAEKSLKGTKHLCLEIAHFPAVLGPQGLIEISKYVNFEKFGVKTRIPTFIVGLKCCKVKWDKFSFFISEPP